MRGGLATPDHSSGPGGEPPPPPLAPPPRKTYAEALADSSSAAPHRVAAPFGDRPVPPTPFLHESTLAREESRPPPASPPASPGGVPAPGSLRGLLSGTVSTPRSMPSTPRRLLGRPKVSLPVSQLVPGARKPTPPWYASGWHSLETCGLAHDPREGDVLRVLYPRGSGNSHAGVAGGCGFRAVPRCLPGTDVTLEYAVRFPDTFRWSAGGKLPGLFVGDGHASGGRREARAASVRLMWQRGGYAIAYVYTPAGVSQPAAYRREAGGPPREYGDGLFKGARLRFRRGGWNTVVLRVRLNTFDERGRPNSDGQLSLAVNGRVGTLAGGIVWRRYPDVKISEVTFSTFYGGTWTSPADTHADFARFACSS